MGWIFKIKEPNDVEEWGRHYQRLIEIQSIKRRIEKLRKELHPSRPRTLERAGSLEERPRPVEPVHQDKESKRNAELDAIKAKLTGGKL